MKRRLSDKQKQDIAKIYACNIYVTIDTLSKKYNVSKTTISKALHFAIEYKLVKEEIARQIAKKAINKASLHGNNSKNVANLYGNLLKSYLPKETTKKSVVSSVSNEELKSKIAQITYQLDCFDGTFCDEELKKEDLEHELFALEQELESSTKLYLN